MERGRTIARPLGTDARPDTFNPVIVDFYEQIGFLPEAILNYLALLGWSLDDKREDFSRARVDREFFAGAGKQGPGQLRSQEALAFQDRYMQRLPLEEKLRMTLPYLQRAGLVGAPAAPEIREEVGRLCRRPTIGSRWPATSSTTRSSSKPTISFRTTQKAAEKWLRKPQVAELLPKLRDGSLAAGAVRCRPRWSMLMHEFVESRQGKIGEIVHPVRVASPARRGLRAVRHPGDPGRGSLPGADRSGVGSLSGCRIVGVGYAQQKLAGVSNARPRMPCVFALVCE